MSLQEKPIVPFVLSLIAGFLILLGAIVMPMFAFGALPMMGMYEMMGMMGGMYGGMGTVMMGFSTTLSVIGLVSGALVISGSVMLYRRPEDSQLWGAVILAFSLISALGGMAGFIVGLLLGVVGGTMALARTWNAKAQKVTAPSL